MLDTESVLVFAFITWFSNLSVRDKNRIKLEKTHSERKMLIGQTVYIEVPCILWIHSVPGLVYSNFMLRTDVNVIAVI